MNRLFMILLVALVTNGTVYAQDESGGGGSFDSGDLLIEITGNPFSGSSLLNYGSLRVRYGVADAIVPRLGIEMDLNNEQVRPDYVSNYSSYELRPGCEYHLRVDGAFRSYAALDLILGQRFASIETTTGQVVDGYTGGIPNSATPTLSSGSRGYFDYGVGLNVGADYHLTSRFYMGVEIGFDLYRRKYSEVTVDGELFQDSITSSFGDVNINNSFRIGFKLL